MKEDTKLKIKRNVTNAAGAFIISTLTSPLQVIKVRLQCGGQLVKQGITNYQYSGIRDCLNKILKQQGWKGFFKGNLAFCLNKSIVFVLDGMYKKQLNQLFISGDPKQIKDRNLTQIMLMSLPTIIITMPSYPFQYSHIKLANNITKVGTKQPKYKSILQIIDSTYVKQGIKGIYRGATLLTMSLMLYRTTYLSLSQAIRIKFANNQYMKGMLIGIVMNAFAGGLVYPLNTIRYRLIMSTQKKLYNTAYDCFKEIIAAQSYMSLYKGFSIFLIKGIISTILVHIYLVQTSPFTIPKEKQLITAN